MTKREENKIFRETLHERFFWTYSTGLKNYLTENGHKFLFRCTHFKRNNSSGFMIRQKNYYRM